jgi:hypothetical protein
MSALTYAADATNTVQEGTGTPLFDRVRRSIELGRVREGLDDLFGGLAHLRNTMEPEAWRAFVASVRKDGLLDDLVYQDFLTRRALEKPRGYAGDAVMMDYVYGIHGYRQAAGQASDIGRAICRYIQRGPAGQGVRIRREHIARLIDEIAFAVPAADVLAVASGHLREAELSNALRLGRLGRFVALDADVESLREVDAQYSQLGVETIHASVRHILARKVTPGRFDFVYAAGLYDYLGDPVGAALTARLFDLTNPGGQLLIPNFAPRCPDRAYLEAFMEWNLIYRDEFDMTALLARIPEAQIARYDIYSDTSGSIVYLRVRKAKLANAAA